MSPLPSVDTHLNVSVVRVSVRAHVCLAVTRRVAPAELGIADASLPSPAPKKRNMVPNLFESPIAAAGSVSEKINKTERWYVQAIQYSCSSLMLQSQRNRRQANELRVNILDSDIGTRPRCLI